MGEQTTAAVYLMKKRKSRQRLLREKMFRPQQKKRRRKRMGKNGAGGRMMNKPKVSKKIGPASQKIGHASQGLKMGRLDLKWDGMLCLFFNNPAKEFQIREISRWIGVPKTTVQRVLKQLVSLKIILVKKKGIFPSYSAN